MYKPCFPTISVMFKNLLVVSSETTSYGIFMDATLKPAKDSVSASILERNQFLLFDFIGSLILL